VVQELVAEAVLAHEAGAAGLDGGSHATQVEPSPDAVDRLVEEATASVRVTTREVRSYYVRNRDRYRRSETRLVRHILVADEASARNVVERLAAGGDMASIAGEVSIDPGSRRQGGLLGDVRRGELTGPLEDALFAAEVGAVVGPIRTEHGWHVARLERVTPASCVRYVGVRPFIEADLLAAKRTTAFATWLDARRSALAVIEPGYEHPAQPGHGFQSHRH
jgi:parvulin-like peptidyl-prolyl isomerase